MKPIRYAIFLFLPTLLPVLPLAASPYVQGLFQWVDSDLDNSHSLGARAGFTFGEVNALELEYTYTSLNQDRDVFVDGTAYNADAKAKVHILMLNYKFSYRFTERFAAFVGAGAGVNVADVKVDTQFGREKGQDAVFAYQGFFGLEFYILPDLSVHGAYRRQEYEDFKFSEGDFSITVDGGGANIFELGATYYF